MPPARPQTFTLADVRKIVQAEIAKLGTKRVTVTHAVAFAESGNDGLKPGQVSQPWQRKNDGAGKPVNKPVAIPSRPVPVKDTPRPSAAGGTVLNLVGKFADRMPDNLVCPPEAEITEELDPGEREEMLKRMQDLDDNLTPDHFASVPDRDLVPIHHKLHELAGVPAPSTKQRLRQMVGASPVGKAMQGARQKAKVAKHDDVDDDVMPSMESRAVNLASKQSADGRQLQSETHPGKVKKFSDGAPSDHGRTLRYVSPVRSGMTPERRRQLLAATPCGKAALKRLAE